MSKAEYRRFTGTEDTRFHGPQRIVDALLHPEIGQIEVAFSTLWPRALEINYMTTLTTFSPDLKLKEQALYFKELARQGGYAAFYKEGVTKKPIVFKVGGVATAEEDAEYQRSTQAKLETLRNDPATLVSGHIHHQIDGRDVLDGAIRTEDGWIISFDGFRPDLNELFCLAVANYAGIIDTTEAHIIAGISGNKIFNDYFKVLCN